jgi:uncharacterized hydrophobic protein (TIGR00271 family)
MENKFDFEDEKATNVDVSSEKVKADAKNFVESTKQFVSNIFDFRNDIDTDETIEAIQKDIPFKGATSWILICSIFVASVGLNADSTAVVIGAMLISPLMGPILGIGLALAINDIFTLRKALINFGIMVVLSVLTAFLFFWLFPLSEVTSELFARTRPDIRDVLIAFFGGLALIIARTKRGTIASVIFGVAIATALMPPLCTAGFGLAKGNMTYFLGAMYLFLINTIFIALATFLVLKVLRFPMLHYANSKKRKQISRIASVLAIVVMIPAVWTFLNVLSESNFNRDAKDFIDIELKGLPYAEFIQKNATSEYINKDKQTLEINTFGLEVLPESTIEILESKKKNYSALKNTELVFNQNNSTSMNTVRYMEQLRYSDSIVLMSQTERIKLLENRLRSLSHLEKYQIPFEQFSKEVKINYENIDQIAYSNVVVTNFSKMDTLSVFEVKWKSNVGESNIESQNKKLEQWLKVKYNLDSLVVKQMD